jgi:hypothetical protein
MELGDTTMTGVQTLLEAILEMSLRFACFINKAFFSGKKQNFRSWDYCPQAPDYQDFWVIR